MSARAEVAEEFTRRFGSGPQFVTRAPGRVNLIGEHTDYNEGLVLPVAIDREICIAFRPRNDESVLLHSIDFDETVQINLPNLERGDPHWVEYLKGVAWVLTDRFRIHRGWEGVISGEVPRGAGLASSAALELAIMRAFAVINRMDWNAAEAALAAQRVENEWIGVQSGIMDQLVVASAHEQHAMLIDCRSLAVHHVPMPGDISV
ncbi:MAG TPA: galactokinase family protein, partial [Longimicrobiales bacterium]